MWIILIFKERKKEKGVQKEGKRWTEGKKNGHRWKGKEISRREKWATGTQK